MPRKGLTEFRVGVFVVAGLVLAMMIIFMIGGEHRLFERHYTLYANFDDISGLRVGAPVQLAGMQVGYVDKIVLPKDMEARHMTVVLKVQRQYQERIRQDSLATIETQGLLGDKFIYISMGSEAQAVIADKGIIASKETTSIFSLADKAGSIMDDIRGASDSIAELLGTVKEKKGDGDLKATIKSIRNTVEQIEKGKGFAHALIYDSKGEQTMSDIADTVRAIRDIASGAKQSSKGEFGGFVTNLRQASLDLKQILEQVKRGEGTLGKLVSDPSLYDDLRGLFGRVNRNRLLRAVVRSTISENDKQLGVEQSSTPPRDKPFMDGTH